MPCKGGCTCHAKVAVHAMQRLLHAKCKTIVRCVENVILDRNNNICQIYLQFDYKQTNHLFPMSVQIDYLSPLMVKMKKSECKRYGCLFTCMTTRAIYLELSYYLTSSAFINAIRIFLARGGPVKYIYSVNGTNFVSAECILNDSLLNN